MGLQIGDDGIEIDEVDIKSNPLAAGEVSAHHHACLYVYHACLHWHGPPHNPTPGCTHNPTPGPRTLSHSHIPQGTCIPQDVHLRYPHTTGRLISGPSTGLISPHRRALTTALRIGTGVAATVRASVKSVHRAVQGVFSCLGYMAAAVCPFGA